MIMSKKTPVTVAQVIRSSKVIKLVSKSRSEDADELSGKRWISMSNALIRAGHGLTLAEKRLVVIALSKLDSRGRIDAAQPPITRITASEYSEEADVSMNTAYEHLQGASKHLFERKITFFEPAHKRNGKAIEPPKVAMRWVGQVEYHKGEGWVELHWWSKLLPHLMALKKQFTSYQLQQTSALRSMYSWRLLELLMRFESTGWAEYTIEDFCTSMDATEKQRTDFNNIKRRMIEPAVRELTEKDGWIIKWEPIKEGRRVVALRFEFRRDPQGRLL